MPSKFMESAAPYIQLAGGCGWDREQKAVIGWDEVSSKLIKQGCTRGTHRISRMSQMEHTAAWN